MPHSPHVTTQTDGSRVHAAAQQAAGARRHTVVAWHAEFFGGPFASRQEWTTRPARRIYVFESGSRDERAPEAPAPTSASRGGEAILGWYEPTFEEEGLRMQWYPVEAA